MAMGSAQIDKRLIAKKIRTLHLFMGRMYSFVGISAVFCLDFSTIFAPNPLQHEA